MNKTIKSIFMISITLVVIAISVCLFHSCSMVFSTYQLKIDNVIGEEYIDEKSNYIITFDDKSSMTYNYDGDKKVYSYTIDTNVIVCDSSNKSYKFVFYSDDLIYFMNKNIYLLRVVYYEE